MDIVVEILTYGFIVLFYVVGVPITATFAKEYIISYTEKRRNRFISLSAERYIRRYHMGMTAACALMFPLYYCFIYGSFYARAFYNILIENKDENRLASWLF
jgi:hypothetical protein